MIAIPLPDAQLITFDEFLEWKPDNTKYELHNGTPIEMQPTGDHEDVVEFLSTSFTLEVGRLGLPYRFPRNGLIKVPHSETGYLPDILLVHANQLQHEPLWKKSATITMGSSVVLIVEVVSQNWRDDYGHKLADYEALGIPEYWIADYRGLGGIRYIGSPKRPTLSIYHLDNGEYGVQQFRDDEVIVSPTFPTLTLTANQILSGGAAST